MYTVSKDILLSSFNKDKLNKEERNAKRIYEILKYQHRWLSHSFEKMLDVIVERFREGSPMTCNTAGEILSEELLLPLITKTLSDKGHTNISITTTRCKLGYKGLRCWYLINCDGPYQLKFGVKVSTNFKWIKDLSHGAKVAVVYDNIDFDLTRKLISDTLSDLLELDHVFI
jgi:hypothetical protein